METQIAKIVRMFRKELASRNSTFFLIYSDIDVRSNQVTVKVTTNSTVEGVSSILGTVLEPTEAALFRVMDAFQTYASMRVGDSGVLDSARGLLTDICKLLTIKNIEPSAPSPIVKA